MGLFVRQWQEGHCDTGLYLACWFVGCVLGWLPFCGCGSCVLGSVVFVCLVISFNTNLRRDFDSIVGTDPEDFESRRNVWDVGI